MSLTAVCLPILNKKNLFYLKLFFIVPLRRQFSVSTIFNVMDFECNFFFSVCIKAKYKLDEQVRQHDRSLDLIKFKTEYVKSEQT